ncbi:hypothetical protein [Paraburkholderia tropica]|uniref:hypothetical protein n=1 Tax=Paraburkholderia tropica TaxID=92647 RepID=UPI002AB73D74|nr:hypothetical protein [Paraburkholderia tropica]
MKDIGSLFGDKEKARFARFVFALLFAAVMLTMALGTAWSTRDFIEESQVVPGRVLKLNAGGSHPIGPSEPVPPPILSVMTFAPGATPV